MLTSLLRYWAVIRAQSITLEIETPIPEFEVT